MPLTPQQCRAARGLLGWTQEELAARAGVSRSTVRGFENGRHELHRGSAAVIRIALEAAGAVLIDPDEGWTRRSAPAGACPALQSRSV